MSEKLKRKLYDYEVNPPEKMWGKITAAMDEETGAKFPQTLYEMEATPPAKIWDQLAESLEKDAKQKYPAKLYDLSVDPPTGMWEKISVAIREEKNLPRISSRRKTFLWVKYAAAACFIGFVAIMTLYFFNSKKENAISQATVAPKNNSQTIIPDNNENPSAQTPVPSNNLPNEGVALATTNSISKKKNPLQQAGYMAQLVTPAVADDNASLDCAFQDAVLHGNVPGNCSLISEEDPYLMFTNPDGYLTRISKKLAERLGCAYTKGNSGKCEKQLKKWRDKIAQSPASSSPDNFMELLDIIKSVNQ